MKTKTLSQIALALAVGSSAVFFTACGADEEKKPNAYIYKGFGTNPVSINITSKDDETIIKDVVVRGRNGECPLQKDVLNGEKIVYNKDISVPFSEDIQSGKLKCEPKNGKVEIKIKTNFGTYTYENSLYY